jgi:hypothetical protein
MTDKAETSPVPRRRRSTNKMAHYPEAIYAIADFKQPPVDVMKVANWHLVRFTAKIFRRTAREVAADVIDCSIRLQP